MAALEVDDEGARLRGQADFLGVHLNATNLEEFMTFARREREKWKVTKQVFQMNHQIYRGVNNSDIQNLEAHWRNKGKQQQADMLAQVILIGEGMSSTVIMLDTNHATEKAYVITARRQDGFYDVLVCECSQRKSVDGKRVAAASSGCLFIATVAAVGTGIATQSPVLAKEAFAGTLLLTGGTCAVKGVSEYNEAIVDKASAFMLTELVDSGVVEVVDGELRLVDAIQNQNRGAHHDAVRKL